MKVYTSIEDLRRHYIRRTPKMFYDYVESGSWTEQTFRENTSDFQHIHLKQRVAVDMSGRTTRSQMIGEDVAMPVALAPVGVTGMQSADGEIKAARAAEKFGVLLHTIDHVDMFDRRCCRAYDQALLASGLHTQG